MERAEMEKAKRGRKPLGGGKTVKFPLVLTEELREELEATAAAIGVNRQQAVRSAIETWVKRYKKRRESA